MFETFINERIFTENLKNGVLQVRMKSYHIFAVSLKVYFNFCSRY